MIEWLRHFWEALTWTEILAGTGLILGGMAVSFVSVSFVLVRLPENYFHSDYEHHFLPESRPVIRTAGLIVKNVIGVFLIILGIILAIPGVPGPGFLTFFIGIILTDIPGKRVLEAKIINRPSIYSTVNKLRSKYNKPPLVMDQ
jgi:hypothetical protein